MSRQARIEAALRAALDPVQLEVINESELHAGHRGSPGTGESHYRVAIVSDRFTGRSRVDRHRLVTEPLAAEFAGGLHALAIMARASGEV